MRFISIAAAFGIWACAQGAESTNSVTLLTAEGKVEWMKAGADRWSKAEPGLAIQVRDRVRTGPKSRAAVRLFDASVIRIAPLTTFELLPAENDRRPAIDLKSGSMFFFSRQKPEEVRFRTPTVSGAIRGTEFTISAGENGVTELALIDGEVALRQEEEEVLLRSGERAVATRKEITKQPLLNARNVIQWVLYYPAILDPAEVEAGEAYRSGDLLAAAEDAGNEGLYGTALKLAFGDVAGAKANLEALPESPGRRGLERLIAAVLFEDHGLTNAPSSASEWLGESYFQQSRGNLDQARAAAQVSVDQSPQFGFGWVRLAELEFAHENTKAALDALARGLELSPRHAQGHALRGFIYTAHGRKDRALASFERALELNGGLGSAWLGRGLAKIKSGDLEEGLQDIQTAVALEPQRVVFRAYLGKAFGAENKLELASKDLRLAKQLDPADPTAWLYSGLLDQQQNRINTAITNLQEAIEKNDNQRIQRSTFLLDQDRATRAANLASVYRDASMLPVSRSLAARGVSHDYANYASHLFLAQTYDLLRDPAKYNLRYESARQSELYLASLLAPVGGFNLSQNVGNQDAARLFEQRRVGVSSETEYQSRGAWEQIGSHFGTFDNFAYSLDAYYRIHPGHRPNNDAEQRTLSLQAKYQLNYRDSIYIQALHAESETGDVVQRYDQSTLNPDVRVKEEHAPDLLAGFHRAWSPGNHTLLMFGRSDVSLEIDDPDVALLFFRRMNGQYTRIQPAPWHSLDYEREQAIYAAEAQQIWKTGRRTYLLGARSQFGDVEVQSSLADLFQQPLALQNQDNDFYRFSLYGYQQWSLLDSLIFTAGLSYDRLRYPRNVDRPPLSADESTVDQLSPKFGLIWTPWRSGAFRAAFTRSLGGFSLDSNLRIEPTHVGGFNQVYRSFIPESVAGVVYGEEMQTISAGYDHVFASRTFIGLEAERLSSEADRTFGIVTSGGFLPVPDTAAGTYQQFEFEETALRFYGYQLLGRDFVGGVNYRVARAELESRLPEISATLPEAQLEREATLHEVLLNLTWNHPSGFFWQAESGFYAQDNARDLPGPGDRFWQHNFFMGYRFAKRLAEARLGLLNLADQNYQLNPLNVHLELPRERTLSARLRLNF